jgi:transcriptional regulator of nitric oxide reductase
MTNVLEAFKNIVFVAHKDEDARNSLFNYLIAIVDDINEHVSNEYDRQEITNMLNAIARISKPQGEKLVARFTNQQTSQ